LSVTAEEIGLIQIRRAAHERPVLVGTEFVPAPTGEARAAALKHLARSHQLGRTPCTTVVQRGSYKLLLVEAPSVSSSELRAAIRWRIRDDIDFHIDDAVIDIFEAPARKGMAKSNMLYVVVARAPTVKTHVDGLLDAGIKLGIVDVPELAFRNVASLLPEDETGVVLVDLDQQGGLVTVTARGTLYLSRTINVTREEILMASSEDGQILTELAERILDTIVIEVQRSLDYYESYYGQAPVAGIRIGPLGKPIPGMEAYLSAQLGLNTRILDLNELLETSEPLPLSAQTHGLSLLGAALRREAVPA
jgi:MSHA biogenesis protein MshI